MRSYRAIQKAKRKTTKIYKSEKPKKLFWRDRRGWRTAFGIGEIVAFSAVGVGLFAYSVEFQDRIEERNARAWQLIMTPAPGNSGKIGALEYLNSESPKWVQDYLYWFAKKRESLRGIDLSCADEHWDGDDNSCSAPVYLRQMNLQGADLGFANLKGADLFNANLKGADLGFANLKGAGLRAANLKGAKLYVANLRGADLGGANLKGAELSAAKLQGADLGFANLKGAHLHAANLKGADLYKANLQGANLRAANLKGANLLKADLQGALLLGANLKDVWAWNTFLPIGLVGYEIEVCDSELGDSPFTKPETGCVLTMME